MKAIKVKILLLKNYLSLLLSRTYPFLFLSILSLSPSFSHILFPEWFGGRQSSPRPKSRCHSVRRTHEIRPQVSLSLSLSQPKNFFFQWSHLPALFSLQIFFSSYLLTSSPHRAKCEDMLEFSIKEITESDYR